LQQCCRYGKNAGLVRVWGEKKGSKNIHRWIDGEGLDAFIEKKMADDGKEFTTEGGEGVDMVG
jgi:hypothetical protein